MLNTIINKIRPQVKRPILLGDVYVNGRSDFKSFIEFNPNGENSPDELKEWIKELLEIPLLGKDKDVAFESLIFDIAVKKYQVGTDAGLYSNPFIPLFWRPSITIDFRVREYNTNKTLGEHSVKKIMGWGECYRRIFSLRAMFSFTGTFTSQDLKLLMAKSIMDGLVWAKKRTNS